MDAIPITSTLYELTAIDSTSRCHMSKSCKYAASWKDEERSQRRESLALHNQAFPAQLPTTGNLYAEQGILALCEGKTKTCRVPRTAEQANHRRCCSEPEEIESTSCPRQKIESRQRKAPLGDIYIALTMSGMVQNAAFFALVAAGVAIPVLVTQSVPKSTILATGLASGTTQPCG